MTSEQVAEMHKVNTELDEQYKYTLNKISETIQYPNISNTMKLDIIQEEINRMKKAYQGKLDRVINNL